MGRNREEAASISPQEEAVLKEKQREDLKKQESMFTKNADGSTTREPIPPKPEEG